MGRKATRAGCSVKKCRDPHYAKGWCAHHYHMAWKYGDPLAGSTKLRTRTVGRVPAGTKCSVGTCNKPFVAKGFCRKHYTRFTKYGDPLKTLRGPQGQGSVKRGYVYLTLGGRGGRRVLAHRHVMEESLGRPLLAQETVHHKNGIRSDNRLVKGHELHCPSTCCNLELWSKSQPSGQRVQDRLKWAREIIRLYTGVAEENEQCSTSSPTTSPPSS